MGFPEKCISFYMNPIKRQYSNEIFFSLNISQLSVRGSMLPLILAKELNITDKKIIIQWFDQNASNDEKKANFKNYFNIDYTSLKYDYVDYIGTLNKNNCEFTLCLEHLNVEKTKKEVLSKMIVFLSFLGNNIEVVENNLRIDNYNFDLNVFLDAYIGTFNILLSPKIKKFTLQAYGFKTLNLFDCFIIKLQSNLISYGYVKKDSYAPIIELIEGFYPSNPNKVA